MIAQRPYKAFAPKVDRKPRPLHGRSLDYSREPMRRPFGARPRSTRTEAR